MPGTYIEVDVPMRAPQLAQRQAMSVAQRRTSAAIAQYSIRAGTRLPIAYFSKRDGCGDLLPTAETPRLRDPARALSPR